MNFKLRDFKDNGYNVVRCDKASPFEKDWSTWLCQKKVYSKDGSKVDYFINIYISDMRLWEGYDSFIYESVKDKRSLGIKLQLTRCTYDSCIFISDIPTSKLIVDEVVTDISIYGGDWIREVSDVDRHVAQLFDVLNCVSYDEC